MIGASLSRWSMAYFAAALIALFAAEIMMTAGFGFPGATVAAPETLILVHVVAIGWLSLLMCGALLQFVPVLVVQPLYSDTLALPALVLLVSGLAALVLGFLQLGGYIGTSFPFLAAASVLLGCGFALIIWNLGRTLAAAPKLPLPARFVTVGLVCVAATVTLGIIFALVLGGTVNATSLLVLTGIGRPIHATAGLGGWLTFTAMGVSYRLLAMFMLAPDLERPTTRAALLIGTIALAVAIAGGVIAALTHGNPAIALLAAFIGGVLALALYGADVRHLYRARKRKNIELNSRMTAFAFASLAASVVLIAVLLGLGQLEEHIGAVVFLVAFGWLSGLGLAQLYKIVAFLTWLECYGPILGKAPTPRVQDLVVEPRAVKWFRLYLLAVWAGEIVLLAGLPLLFRVATAAMFVATIGIAGEILRTRRLHNVAAASRLPAGAQLPRLLISSHA